jgi:hypothetical protein
MFKDRNDYKNKRGKAGIACVEKYKNEFQSCRFSHEDEWPGTSPEKPNLS